jgi:hypothetical protein
MYTGMRNMEAQTKVAAFFDRVSRRASGQNVVSILRIDNGVVNQIGVDVATKAFFIPGA